MIKRKCRKAIALALLLGVMPIGMSGCYGRFPLVRSVYEFNGEIKNGVLEQIVFWVFWPWVYGVAGLADAVIFNVIEFWSGGGVELSSTTLEDGTELTFAPGANEDEAILSVARDGTIEQTIRFVRVSDEKCAIYDEQGVLAGWTRATGDGSVQLTDANGAFVREISSSSIVQ